MSPGNEPAAALRGLHAAITAALPADAADAVAALDEHVPVIRARIDEILARPASGDGLRAVLLGFDAVKHLRIAVERPLAGPGAALPAVLDLLYAAPELEAGLCDHARALRRDPAVARCAGAIVAELAEQGCFLDAAARGELAALDGALAAAGAALDAAVHEGRARDVFVQLGRGLALVRRRRALLGAGAPDPAEREAVRRAIVQLAEGLRGAGIAPRAPAADPEVIDLDAAIDVFAARVERALGLTLEIEAWRVRARTASTHVPGDAPGRLEILLAPPGDTGGQSEAIAHSVRTVVVRTRFDGGARGDRLTFPHVLSLFHELGHAVHHLTDDPAYPNLAGLAATPPARREIASYFGEALALDARGGDLLASASGDGARLVAEAGRRRADLTGHVLRCCYVALCELAFEDAGVTAPAALVELADGVARASETGAGLGDLVELIDAGVFTGTGMASYLIGRIAGAALAASLDEAGVAAPGRFLAAIRDPRALAALDPGPLLTLYAGGRP